MSTAAAPSSPMMSKLSPWLWLLLTLGLVFLSYWALTAAPYPDAYRVPPRWTDFKDFWLYPYETNAYRRLPIIPQDLKAVQVSADGQHVWAWVMVA